MEALEIGDNITLNGNDTVMVVEATYDDNVVCVWHDKNSMLHREVFNQKIVNKINQ